jgi:dTMP kinase
VPVSTPRFIVLEGVEGSGKSTQIRLLSSWLEGLGVDHVTTREPGGTSVGEAIRQVLLDRDGLEMPDETELLLMLGARAAFVRGVVQPALDAGQVVLADRFDLSTYAYQGYGRGLPLDEVRSMNEFATGGVRPDMYLVLDLPADEGRERQAREGKTLDRIERAGDGFLERVRNGYRELAEAGGRVQLVNARGTPEEVHARLRGVLESTFPETFRPASV